MTSTSAMLTMIDKCLSEKWVKYTTQYELTDQYIMMVDITYISMELLKWVEHIKPVEVDDPGGTGIISPGGSQGSQIDRCIETCI